MAVITLKRSFEKLPEGTHTMTVMSYTDVNNVLTLRWEDEFGRYSTTRYDLKDSNGHRMLTFHRDLLIPYEQGEPTVDPEEFIGVKAVVEVTHSKGKSPNAKGEYPIYVNISKIVELLD